MIKFENVVTPSPEQWRSVIMGARNPLNSWDRSDSCFEEHTLESWPHDSVTTFEFLGDNDRDLLMRLRNAGTDHRKFMRMLPVHVTITAPLYWWKEMDQYRVGQTTNSCSTMHKIHAKEFALEDFSMEHLFNETENGYFGRNAFSSLISDLNKARSLYLETKDKKYWWQMIQLLPSSYNQKRTVMLNYEVLANIYKSRKDHKLDEWHTFCHWIEELPYSEIILGHYSDEEE